MLIKQITCLTTSFKYKTCLYAVLIVVLFCSCNTNHKFTNLKTRQLQIVNQIPPEHRKDTILNYAPILAYNYLPIKQNQEAHGITNVQYPAKVKKVVLEEAIQKTNKIKSKGIDVSNKYKKDNLSPEEKLYQTKRDAITASKYFTFYTLLSIASFIAYFLIDAINTLTLIIATLAFTTATLAFIALILAIILWASYFIKRRNIRKG